MTTVIAPTAASADEVVARSCVEHLRLTFSPPLTTANTGGTATASWNRTCAVASVDTDPPSESVEVVASFAERQWTYVGSCVTALFSGGVINALLGGSVLVTDNGAALLVPDQPCNVSSAAGEGAGFGFTDEEGEPPPPPPPADPPAPPDGPGCTFAATDDPSVEAPEGVEFGSVQAGPLVGNGEVACTVKVGDYGATHATTWGSLPAATATSTNGVAVLAPTLVSYWAGPWQYVYLCMMWTHDGNVTPQRLYWDGSAGVWSDNPYVPCTLSISVDDTYPVNDLIEDVRDDGLRLTHDLVDWALCPLLQNLSGSYAGVYVTWDGDVYAGATRIYDCQPWGEDDEPPPVVRVGF